MTVTKVDLKIISFSDIFLVWCDETMKSNNL